MTEGGRAHISPRTAVVWEVLRDELSRRAVDADETTVLDLGGGSGVFAVPLAELGHRVTVVDASPDALATLRRRAVEVGVADRVSAICGDVDGLAGELPPDGYDVVLCHQLLEMVDDPVKTLATVAGAVRPGGCASVLVAGRAAAVLSRALGGHPADALRALTDPAGRWSDADSALRRFDIAEVSALIAGAGLTVEAVHGIRVVTDLVPGTLEAVPGVADALRALELAVAALPPYREIATQLHVLARR